MNIDMPALQSEKADLEKFLSNPEAFSDPEYTNKSKRLSEIDNIVEKSELIDSLKKQLSETRELASGDGELAELAKVEMTENEDKLANLEEELSEILTP